MVSPKISFVKPNFERANKDTIWIIFENTEQNKLI